VPAILDARDGALDIMAASGTTVPFDFVWPAGSTLTSASVWLGGTLDDWTDLEGATEHVATIAGTTATVSLPVPTVAQGPTPIRLMANGSARPLAAGELTPSSLGSRAPAGDIVVRTDAATITIRSTALGGRTDALEAGAGIEVDDTDPAVPVVAVAAEVIAGAEAGATAVQPDALGTAAAADADAFATAAQGEAADTAVQPDQVLSPAAGRGIEPDLATAGLLKFDFSPVLYGRRKAGHVEEFWTPNGGTAGWDGTIPASFADLAALRAYLVLARNHKVGEPAWTVTSVNGGNVKSGGLGQVGGVSVLTGSSSATGRCTLDFPPLGVLDIGSATGAKFGFIVQRGASSAAQAYRAEFGLHIPAFATAHAIGVRITAAAATTVVGYVHNGTTETTFPLATLAQDFAEHFEFEFTASGSWTLRRGGEVVATLTPAPILALLFPFVDVLKTAGTGTERGITVDQFTYELDRA
jgi:hypothetical protein